MTHPLYEYFMYGHHTRILVMFATHHTFKLGQSIGSGAFLIPIYRSVVRR